MSANPRIPPHNIEAEQSVIGGLMLSGMTSDGSAWDKIAGRVGENDFYRQDHRLIFRAMGRLVESGQPLDLVTLSEDLKKQGDLDKAGGFAYLGTMAKDTPSAANIVHYADIVREKAQRRNLIALLQEGESEVFQRENVPAATLLRSMEERLFRLADAASAGRAEVEALKPALKRVVQQMQDNAGAGSGHLLGETTGFTELDEMLSGLEPGNLVVLAARPSMGKSALMGDFELAVASGGKPTLCFSLEMPTDQLVMRHLSRRGSVPLQHVRKTWKMREDDWPKVAHGVKSMADMPMYFVDQPGISPGEIRAIARRMQRECMEKHGTGLGLISVDYLQLMAADMGSNPDNRTNEVGSFSRALKALAKELNVPVVALSQLNRSLEQRPNKRPVMSDLRDSGAVEQDADVIIFIYRDEVYKPDSEDKGVAEIIVSKQRNGPTGTVRLTFQGEFTRFRSYSPDVYEGGY